MDVKTPTLKQLLEYKNSIEITKKSEIINSQNYDICTFLNLSNPIQYYYTIVSSVQNDSLYISYYFNYAIELTFMSLSLNNIIKDKIKNIIESSYNFRILTENANIIINQISKCHMNALLFMCKNETTISINIIRAANELYCLNFTNLNCNIFNSICLFYICKKYQRFINNYSRLYSNTAKNLYNTAYNYPIYIKYYTLLIQLHKYVNEKDINPDYKFVYNYIKVVLNIQNCNTNDEIKICIDKIDELKVNYFMLNYLVYILKNQNLIKSLLYKIKLNYTSKDIFDDDDDINLSSINLYIELLIWYNILDLNRIKSNINISTEEVINCEKNNNYDIIHTNIIYTNINNITKKILIDILCNKINNILITEQNINNIINSVFVLIFHNTNDRIYENYNHIKLLKLSVPINDNELYDIYRSLIYIYNILIKMKLKINNNNKIILNKISLIFKSLKNTKLFTDIDGIYLHTIGKYEPFNNSNTIKNKIINIIDKIINVNRSRDHTLHNKSKHS